MSRNKEIDDFLRQQIAGYGYFDPARRAIARHNGLKHFEDYCDIHGLIDHNAKTGLCVKCSPPPPSGRPLKMDARSVARREGRTTYTAQCATHGPTAHSVDKGRCLTCYTTTGAPRQEARDSLRAVARRAGSATYMATCGTCGREAHSVQTGKCLTCYTTLGAPRKAPGRPASDNPRAAARRAGEATYDAQCLVHGTTPHSVTHGKCLTCYTTLGAPRKRVDAKVTRCDLGHKLVGIAQHLERERGPDWEERRRVILAAATELSK